MTLKDLIGNDDFLVIKTLVEMFNASKLIITDENNNKYVCYPNGGENELYRD